ncbi:MAG TPA: GntR family transcriptional regulator [Oscillatoriaceae cyanobacterium M33_DOE_052]|uniref:GntR family transcriptional regulator n=1 Tax=Planktothricoides sp. SpSt-374 TaxID=2282167 RepID=A0A7C3VVY4_9CYAN|nr:GntR family transcriptional regulator [Oscillatoriaceae cyanobacterium M33_DOE_052]
MVQFKIQLDSDIPASNQLFNQIRFAIASRQFPPGEKLPSTRALAMQTGLHRNTISKVYERLEELGIVESHAGSGIYVKEQGHEGGGRMQSPLLQKYPQADKVIQTSIDELLQIGCTLNDVRELFFKEIDWRLRSSARVLVTAPAQDIGIGKWISLELEESLGMPVQIVSLEELDAALDKSPFGTVVTTRYFSGLAEAIATPKFVRVIPLDIYDHAKEIEEVKLLPKDSCLGLVSISTGWLRASEVIVNSLRGEELLVVTAHLDDAYKLKAIVRRARAIGCDPASLAAVKAAIQANREDLIRAPKVYCIENYIDKNSINRLKRELGLV